MNKKVLIADEHDIVVLGTSILLKKYSHEITIDSARNYNEVKEKIKNERFDLILLDIEMPGSIFKFMIKDLKLIQQDLMILIFSHYKENVAIEYIYEGAHGFVNKLSDEKTLIKAITSIFEDGYYYTFNLMQYALNPSLKKGTEVLSDRELDVFKLLVLGNGNLEISNILQINTSTVNTYKRRIYTKLEVNNPFDLLKIYNHS